jgi:hypothetical protein
MEDKLEVGKRDHKLTFYTTKGVSDTVVEWAEVAKWTISKTLEVLVIEGIRSYDFPSLPRPVGLGHEE